MTYETMHDSPLSEPSCGEHWLGKSSVLRSRLIARAEANLIPIAASIEITLRCNFRCLHCYNFDRSRAQPVARKSSPLTKLEIFETIDQLKEAGCLFLSLTGGEPLTHPELESFVRHARNRQLHVKIKTNGALLTEQKVSALKGAGLHRFDFSLYGASSQSYASFCGVANGFERMIQGIQSAKDHGIQVHVNLILTRNNAEECSRMIDLCQGLDVSYGFSPFITARYDGTRSSCDLAVDQSTLQRLYAGPLRPFLRKPRSSNSSPVLCGCARSNCGISASGDVYPCIGAPIVSGNLRQASFAEIWANSPQFRWIRSVTSKDLADCRDCGDRPYCGRNSGVVYCNTGDYTGSEPFTCMEASVTRDNLSTSSVTQRRRS